MKWSQLIDVLITSNGRHNKPKVPLILVLLHSYRCPEQPSIRIKQGGIRCVGPRKSERWKPYLCPARLGIGDVSSFAVIQATNQGDGTTTAHRRKAV